MKTDSGHTILLGGIGGDAHSVGLNILRQALRASGYTVYYLGTQNHLEDFFQWAALVNVVMISSMDGHARYYLREFPRLREKYASRGPLWYLGGNLQLNGAHDCERPFLEMGFEKVFVKFVDVGAVLQILARDLEQVKPIAACRSIWEKSFPLKVQCSTMVSDEMLEPGEFESQRHEVLGGWKTGEAARDMSENALFLSRQPSFAALQARVNNGDARILMQPRCGVAGMREQINLFTSFKSAGARVLSYQVDSLTRNNNYAGAAEAMRESLSSGVSTLNGFPVINHGVQTLRRIIEEVRVPLQTRHSTRDPRLLAEISYAGGVTAFEGGAICYNIPYYKDYPLAESISKWQYVDRLTGLYGERFGLKLDREFFGTLTATLIPPCLAIVMNLLEMLLAIGQGVRCVSLGYAEQGNRIQDIAAIRVLREMAGEVCRNLGYKDVQVNTVFQQYMAAFPENTRRAEQLIYQSAITAALSGATRVIVKTPVEALEIPALEANLHGLSLVMRGVEDAALENAGESHIKEECEIIRREARAIFESLIMCGRGSVVEGIVSGFRQGLIDIPFSPSIHNAGQVMTARDLCGAVRFLSTGNLQLERELCDFHREKMNQRRKAEGVISASEDYLLVERDVLQIARSRYQRWPLSG
jgi:methylaspartate mutase epsilon subunit